MATEKTFKVRSVLFLNMDGNVIDIVSWKKAVTLYFKEKAKILEEFKDSFVSSPSYTMAMPSVISATEYKGFKKNAKKSINLNRKNVLIRDNHICSYCGKTLSDSTGTIDHILPLSRSGKNIWTNVTACCVKCNRRKDDSTPEEANMKLLRQPFVPTKDIFLRRFLANEEYECWKPYVKLKS